MIRVFVTGGTFDKEYQELTGRLLFKKTHVREMLGMGRCRLPVRVTTLMMLDSLRMSVAHRRRILRECRRVPQRRIVVTHGTDTMAVTARLLAKSLRGKTVVLTGAMVPYKFGSSDGMFNLGSALAFAQCLPEGVYVAMNGKCFPAEAVRKNRAKGEFESRVRSASR